jgi:hypothetical protein
MTQGRVAVKITKMLEALPYKHKDVSFSVTDASLSCDVNGYEVLMYTFPRTNGMLFAKVWRRRYVLILKENRSDVGRCSGGYGYDGMDVDVDGAGVVDGSRVGHVLWRARADQERVIWGHHTN